MHMWVDTTRQHVLALSINDLVKVPLSVNFVGSVEDTCDLVA